MNMIFGAVRLLLDRLFNGLQALLLVSRKSESRTGRYRSENVSQKAKRQQKWNDTKYSSDKNMWILECLTFFLIDFKFRMF